jgi:RNA polymerase sigma-70 factor (ECF subfamily)
MRVRIALPTLSHSVPISAPIDAPDRLDVASLYRAQAPRVARWAAHLGGPGIEVDDIVQEVFLVVRRRLPDFRGETGKITTWLFRVTRATVAAREKRRR